MKAYRLSYIDGALVNGRASQFHALNPGTDEKLAECALTDTGEVVGAGMAAKRAHLSGALSDLRPIEHGHMVQAMGGYMLTQIIANGTSYSWSAVFSPATSTAPRRRPPDARSLVELCTNQKRRHQTEGLDHERI